ncbi:MAG: PSD1 and planctomycete cytochrome C domain-containing protein [Bryobacteraceae bacterium]|nr:PSD1 and planctomycete cytochrome C domain-containing protein [Bryobacteraceae bacterium]MDW8378732.1 PSD1 and planctomycete cytochrome C domain-containing protein [Bryobacterales bacterium]
MRGVLVSLFLSWVAQGVEDSPRQVSEILAANCLTCHGEKIKMSGLDLRTRESMLKGGHKGPAIVPGDPNRSPLFRHASGLDQPVMPPGKKLQSWQLTVLSRWIATGAPLDKPIAASSDLSQSMAALEERPITEEERQFWSFLPVKRVTPPVPANRAWVKNPIDSFLLKAMEEKNLRPSAETNKRSLVRRAYLDLWGLPPTPAQVQEFLGDSRPDAFERLIDKLLDSPHYGERWARHWLDLARYADSGGFEYDRDRPHAWRYRDWVIRAFTNDLPYDEFARLQIAGDEIAPGDPDALIATGFLRHGPEANIKTELTRMDELDDILSTTTSVFLGMTVGCARCHNHKFDPIPQKDYYRMQAVFFSTKHEDVPLVPREEVERHKAENKRIDALVQPFKQQREELEKPYREKLIAAERAKLPDYIQEALRTPPEKRTEGQKLNVRQVEKTRNFTDEDVIASMSLEDRARHDELSKKIQELEKLRPAPLPSAMAIGEDGPEPLPSYFLHRGSPDSKGSLMRPGVLSVICRQELVFPSAPATAKSSLRRKTFAEWLTSPENPLFARVMVNRIWQHHFGEGLVRTPSNFGKTGERPTHPELLDWLASEFVARKFSMKQMHRLIMTSNAYRMSSDDVAASRAVDPDNRLLWRMPRQRLEGEIIRDSILAVSGALDRKVGGPGVHPYIDPALWQGSSGRTWPGKQDHDPTTWRRSIYVFSKRSIPLPLLEVFDKPDTISSCARRNRSTIAPQALILMNNQFIHLQAEQFAKRLKREAGLDPAKQVELAFELAYARPPSSKEKQWALEFLAAGPEALVDFCQALFNSNEFVYIP